MSVSRGPCTLARADKNAYARNSLLGDTGVGGGDSFDRAVLVVENLENEEESQGMEGDFREKMNKGPRRRESPSKSRHRAPPLPARASDRSFRAKRYSFLRKDKN